MNPKLHTWWDLLMDEQGIVPKAKEKVKSVLKPIEEPVLVSEDEHIPSGNVLVGEVED